MPKDDLTTSDSPGSSGSVDAVTPDKASAVDKAPPVQPVQSDPQGIPAKKEEEPAQKKAEMLVAVQPEIAQPVMVQPVIIQTESAKPENAEPEILQTKAAQPENVQPAQDIQAASGDSVVPTSQTVQPDQPKSQSVPVQPGSVQQVSAAVPTPQVKERNMILEMQDVLLHVSTLEDPQNVLTTARADPNMDKAALKAAENSVKAYEKDLKRIQVLSSQKSHTKQEIAEFEAIKGRMEAWEGQLENWKKTPNTKISYGNLTAEQLDFKLRIQHLHETANPLSLRADLVSKQGKIANYDEQAKVIDAGLHEYARDLIRLSRLVNKESYTAEEQKALEEIYERMTSWSAQYSKWDGRVETLPKPYGTPASPSAQAAYPSGTITIQQAVPLVGQPTPPMGLPPDSARAVQPQPQSAGLTLTASVPQQDPSKIAAAVSVTDSGNAQVKPAAPASPVTEVTPVQKMPEPKLAKDPSIFSGGWFRAKHTRFKAWKARRKVNSNVRSIALLERDRLSALSRNDPDTAAIRGYQIEVLGKLKARYEAESYSAQAKHDDHVIDVERRKELKNYRAPKDATPEQKQQAKEERKKAEKVYEKVAKLRHQARVQHKQFARQYVKHEIDMIPRGYEKPPETVPHKWIWPIRKKLSAAEISRKEHKIAYLKAQSESAKIDHRILQDLTRNVRLHPPSEVERLEKALAAFERIKAIRDKIGKEWQRAETRHYNAQFGFIKSRTLSPKQKENRNNKAIDGAADYKAANLIMARAGKMPEGMEKLEEKMQEFDKIRTVREELRKIAKKADRAVEKSSNKLLGANVDLGKLNGVHNQLKEGGAAGIKRLENLPKDELNHIHKLRRAESAKVDYKIAQNFMRDLDKPPPERVDSIKQDMDNLMQLKALKDQMRVKLEKAEKKYRNPYHAIMGAKSPLRRADELRRAESLQADYNATQQIFENLSKKDPIKPKDIEQARKVVEALEEVRRVRDKILDDLAKAERSVQKFNKRYPELAAETGSPPSPRKTKLNQLQRNADILKTDLAIVNNIIAHASKNYDNEKILTSLNECMAKFEEIRKYREEIKKNLEKAEKSLMRSRMHTVLPSMGNVIPFNREIGIGRNKTKAEKDYEKRHVADLQSDFDFTQKMLKQFEPPNEISADKFDTVKEQLDNHKKATKIRDKLRKQLKESDLKIERYSLLKAEGETGMDRKIEKHARRSSDIGLDYQIVRALIKNAENNPDLLKGSPSPLEKQIEKYQKCAEIRDKIRKSLEESERKLAKYSAKADGLDININRRINKHTRRIADGKQDHATLNALLAQAEKDPKLLEGDPSPLENRVKNYEACVKIRDELRKALEAAEKKLDYYEDKMFQGKVVDRSIDKHVRRVADGEQDHKIMQEILKQVEKDPSLLDNPPYPSKLEERVKAYQECIELRNEIRDQLDQAEKNAWNPRYGWIESQFNGINRNKSEQYRGFEKMEALDLKGDWEFAQRMLDRFDPAITNPPLEATQENLNKIKEQMKAMQELRKVRDELRGLIKDSAREIEKLGLGVNAKNAVTGLQGKLDDVGKNASLDPAQQRNERATIIMNFSKNGKKLNAFQAQRRINDRTEVHDYVSGLLRDAEKGLEKEPQDTAKFDAVKEKIEAYMKISALRGDLRRELDAAEHRLRDANPKFFRSDYGNYVAARGEYNKRAADDLYASYKFTSEMMKKLGPPDKVDLQQLKDMGEVLELMNEARKSVKSLGKLKECEEERKKIGKKIKPLQFQTFKAAVEEHIDPKVAKGLANLNANMGTLNAVATADMDPKALSQHENNLNSNNYFRALALQRLDGKSLAYIQNMRRAEDLKSDHDIDSKLTRQLEKEIANLMPQNPKEAKEKIKAYKEKMAALEELRKTVRETALNALHASEELLRKETRKTYFSPYKAFVASGLLANRLDAGNRVGDHEFAKKMLQGIENKSVEEIKRLQEVMEKLQEFKKNYRDKSLQELAKCEQARFKIGARVFGPAEINMNKIKNLEVPFLENRRSFDAKTSAEERGKIITMLDKNSLAYLQNRRKAMDHRADQLLDAKMTRQLEIEIGKQPFNPARAERQIRKYKNMMKALQGVRKLRDEIRDKLAEAEKKCRSDANPGPRSSQYEQFIAPTLESNKLQAGNLHNDYEFTQKMMKGLEPLEAKNRNKTQEIQNLENVLKKMKKFREKYRDKTLEKLANCEKERANIGFLMGGMKTYELKSLVTSHSSLLNDPNKSSDERAQLFKQLDQKSLKYIQNVRRAEDLKGDAHLDADLTKQLEDRIAAMPKPVSPKFVEREIKQYEKIMKGMADIRKFRDDIRNELDQAEHRLRKSKPSGKPPYDYRNFIKDNMEGSQMTVEALQSDYKFTQKIMERLKPAGEITLKKVNETKQLLKEMKEVRELRNKNLEALEKTEKSRLNYGRALSWVQMREIGTRIQAYQKVNEEPELGKRYALRRDEAQRLGPAGMKYLQSLRKADDIKGDLAIDNQHIKVLESKIMGPPPLDPAKARAEIRKYKEMNKELKAVRKIRDDLRKELEKCEIQLAKGNANAYFNRKTDDLASDYQFAQKLINKMTPITLKNIKAVKKQLLEFKELRKFRDDALNEMNKAAKGLTYGIANKLSSAQREYEGGKVTDGKRDHAAFKEIIAQAENDKIPVQIAKKLCQEYKQCMNARDAIAKRIRNEGLSISMGPLSAEASQNKQDNLRGDLEAMRFMMRQAEKTPDGISQLRKDIRALQQAAKLRDQICKKFESHVKMPNLAPPTQLGGITRRFYKIATQDYREDQAAAKAIMDAVSPKNEAGYQAAQKKLEELQKLQQARDKLRDKYMNAEKAIIKNENKIKAAERKIVRALFYKAVFTALKLDSLASMQDKRIESAKGTIKHCESKRKGLQDARQEAKVKYDTEQQKIVKIKNENKPPATQPAPREPRAAMAQSGAIPKYNVPPQPQPVPKLQQTMAKARDKGLSYAVPGHRPSQTANQTQQAGVASQTMQSSAPTKPAPTPTNIVTSPQKTLGPAKPTPSQPSQQSVPGKQPVIASQPPSPKGPDIALTPGNGAAPQKTSGNLPQQTSSATSSYGDRSKTADGMKQNPNNKANAGMTTAWSRFKQKLPSWDTLAGPKPKPKQEEAPQETEEERTRRSAGMSARPH